jgi:predicted HD phosphohydrolase
VHDSEEQDLTTRHGQARSSEAAALRHVVDSLYAEFGDRQTRDDLHRAVEDEKQRWSTAPVKDFVPILVERTVRSRLRA